MTLTMGLRRSLAMDAGAEALVSDEARLTRHEMVDRVARLAAVLRDLGMQEGDRVAMLAPNSHRYIGFYFGATGAAKSSSPSIRALPSPR